MRLEEVISNRGTISRRQDLAKDYSVLTNSHLDPLKPYFSARIKHYFNPCHVYCRLMDYGFSKSRAEKLAKWFERNIYNGNGGARLSKILHSPSKLLKTLRI